MIAIHQIEAAIAGGLIEAVFAAIVGAGSALIVGGIWDRLRGRR